MLKNNNDYLLSSKETADFLGVTEGTLTVWRTNKSYNIPYVKIGSLVRYRKSVLDKWIDTRIIFPITSNND